LRTARRSSRSSPGSSTSSPAAVAPTRAASSAARASRDTGTRVPRPLPPASSRLASSTSSTSASSSAMLVSISLLQPRALGRRGVVDHGQRHLQPRQRAAQFVAGVGQQALVRAQQRLDAGRRRG
jgi:hypothetical protein